MSGVEILLSSLRDKGVSLSLEGGQLRFRAPKAALDPELLANIRAKKEEIVAFLQQVKQPEAGVTLPPLVRQSRGSMVPLSYAQERLWLVQQRDGDSSYNMSGALVLNGPLSMQALESALRGLVERHEPLRTRFVLEPGQSMPEQCVDASSRLMLSVRKARWEEVADVVKEHAGQIFDLAQGPQLSVLVLELGPEQHVLSLAMHHIIGDGWSVHVLVRDLQELYAAATEGRAPRLEALKLQYADYALWQRQLDLSKGLEYWRSALSGYAGPFDLAPQRPRGKSTGFAGVVKRTLSPELAGRLGRFSQERRASLFMVLLSGWALAVHRQTGQKDLCLGTTVAGREQLALEALIGFFINILGLRFDLTGDLSGEGLVEQVKEVVLNGLAQQAVPFEHLLVAMPELRQESGATPLPVMVRHQNFPEAELQQWASGLEARPLSIEQKRRAKSDLDLQYYGDANGLSVVAEFDTDRFDAERVEALLVEVEQLLGRLIDSPQLPLWRLVELSSEERAKLERWNNTAHTFERMSVTELFARQVELNREGLACVDSEQTLTYGELDRRSDNLARLLQEQGVKPGVRVALYLPRSVYFLTGLLAVWKAGGVYVGIDRSYPEAYVRGIIEEAGPAIILVESGFVPGFAIKQEELLALEEELLKSESGPLEQRAGASPDELAYIAYTSGSTGRPKGVCVEHRQLLNCLQALWEQIPFAADEVVAQKTATTFVVSLKELLGGLLAGIPQVIISDVAVRDIEAFAAELERQRVTRLNVVPSQLAALLEYAEHLKGLRHIVTAGEPLSQSLRQRVEQLLPGARLYNNYGCTELNDVSYCLPGHQDSEGGLVPMGGPISNLKLHVLDEQQRLVPVGVTGELCVEGEAVGSGYWNQPALTAERFVPNPFAAWGARLFRTGDLVRRRADGQLQYLGREDFQIKIRGQRIELAQVEQVLAEHPAVERCAVMGQDAGNEQACLVAYYLVAAGTELTHNELHSWLLERLPAYLVPALYVPMESLPLLPNGKLDRLALPAADAQTHSQQEYRAPEGEIERAIAAIWAEMLKLPLDRIGRQDNFFALGGYSLMATRLVTRIRQAFEVEVPVRAFFEAPTVRELADWVEQITREENSGTDNVAANRGDLLSAAIKHDITLGKDIDSTAAKAHADPVARVFLTGATGFLGAFILEALLTCSKTSVCCLVRPTGQFDAASRLMKALSLYRLWQDKFEERVVVVAGDLSEPGLGMSRQDFTRWSEESTLVLHCGASVHFGKRYSDLRRTNVLGTKEILRLSTTSVVKPVHYISTISAYELATRLSSHAEGSLTDYELGYGTGYAQTKWVAEQVLESARSRGIPVTIYRPGRIWGSTKSGAGPTNDFIWLLIKASIEVGTVPDVEFRMEVVPVDYLSNAIVQMISQPPAAGKTHNIAGGHYFTSGTLWDYLSAAGYRVNLTGYARWKQRLADCEDKFESAARILPLLSQNWEQSPKVNDSTDASLISPFVQTELVFPPIDFDAFARYLDYYRSVGFIPEPS